MCIIKLYFILFNIQKYLTPFKDEPSCIKFLKVSITQLTISFNNQKTL